MFDRFRKDVRVIFERDPAAKSVIEVVVCYSGLHAIWAHRIAHALYGRGFIVLSRIVSSVSKFFTGIEIHPGAKIGEGLFIDHGTGIVIGETAEIGDNVTLYQGVTLGGTGKEAGKRHPTIGNNVVVATGAKVLGSFKVGDYAKIGAGSVVLKEVPPYATVVGIPGRIVVMNGKRVCGKSQRELPFTEETDEATLANENDVDLDHTVLPDPEEDERKKMQEEINNLKQEIAELKELLNEQLKTGK